MLVKNDQDTASAGILILMDFWAKTPCVIGDEGVDY